MAGRFVDPLIKYTTSTLKPMPGAELHFYITGTTTRLATYSDYNGTVPNANPVVALDDGHFPPIFLRGTYRVELKYLGVTQPGWPIDDVRAATDSPLFSELATIADPTMPALVLVDSNNSSNFAQLSYIVSASEASFSRSGYKVVQADPSRTQVNNPIGAPWAQATTSATTILKDGAEVFRADATDVRITYGSGNVLFKSANSCVLEAKGRDSFGLNLQASIDILNLYRSNTSSVSPLILANSTNTQLFSPAAPVITATSTTAQINSGNGAPAISIDNAGRLGAIKGTSTTNTGVVYSGEGGTASTIASIAAVAYDYNSLPSYAGLHMMHYGSAIAGNVITSVPKANCDVLVAQNGANFVITTNSAAPIYLGSNGLETIKLTSTGSCVINGVAHDVQTVNGVGSIRWMKNISGGVVNSGATVAGSGLNYVYASAAGVVTAVATAPAGTWKNITGMNCANNDTVEWLRIS